MTDGAGRFGRIKQSNQKTGQSPCFVSDELAAKIAASYFLSVPEDANSKLAALPASTRHTNQTTFGIQRVVRIALVGMCGGFQRFFARMLTRPEWALRWIPADCSAIAIFSSAVLWIWDTRLSLIPSSPPIFFMVMSLV